MDIGFSYICFRFKIQFYLLDIRNFRISIFATLVRLFSKLDVFKMFGNIFFRFTALNVFKIKMYFTGSETTIVNR